MSNFDKLSDNKKRALNAVGNSMDKFYTLPTEKRQIALDNVIILNNDVPLNHLKE